jgi:phosphatidylserine/phosphatidylglycerophosphate/cardiolipin synthase-like enzyme
MFHLAWFVLDRTDMSPAASRVACFVLSSALAAMGCTEPAGPDGDDDTDADLPADSGDDPYPEEVGVALLEIYALDIWGQFLPDADLAVSRADRAETLATVGYPVARVGLDQAGSLRVELDALDHRQLAVTVDFDGTASLDALSLGELDAAGAGVSLSHELRTLRPDQPPVPVHTLYLGLRHKWFSAVGAPARRGNRLELLMDGEEAWRSVHAELARAGESIALSTWWWESAFELVRDADEHVYQSESERRENTILAVLDRSPATKRVIVNQMWGQDGVLDWLTVDDELLDRGAAAGDDFEFMGQANQTEGIFWFEVEGFDFGQRVRDAHGEAAARAFDPEPSIASIVPPHQVDLTHWPIDVEVQHASYHQKFMVIDGEVAFIGGMNLRRVDWDTSRHLVFEPRRMLFDATVEDREAVAAGEALPDNGPRKDYMMRIEGPAAQDAAEVFQLRWDLLLEEGVDYAENSSAFELDRSIPAAGTSQAQVTATLPDPLWQHSIAESWLVAVASAERYIYIEDQYFRAPMLNDAIAARMAEVPDLRLVVITKPVDEWLDPGCAWTHASDTRFETLFPGRYQTFQLRSFGTQVTWGWDETESRFADIDVHSKLLVVDDVFLSVGSANKNNRGMIYEGELNVAVVDRDFVRAARRRVLANLLPAGTPVSDDPAVWTADLAEAAEWNDQVYQRWDDASGDISLDGAALPLEYAPRGLIYGLEFRTVSDCLIEDVGPDMT